MQPSAPEKEVKNRVETSSSKPDKYLFVRVRQFQTIWKGTVLLWVYVIAHAFFWEGGGAMVLPIFPKRPSYPEFPRAQARRVLQLVATKILVMTECPKIAPA